jgi:hypothetical protein
MNRLFFISVLLIFLSCEKDKDEVLGPDKRILGKWKLIETGKWPYMEQPTAEVYQYYYSDSSTIQYDVGLNSRDTCDFWVDTVLHLIQYDITPNPIHYMYNYKFYDNKLQLDFITYQGDHPTRIYQRMPF